MKTIHKILITLGLVLLCFAGCESDLTGAGDNSNCRDSGTISVKIIDASGVKLYSEDLPLIYVQQFREVNTNSNGKFTFEFTIPNGWGLLFESEPISFNSVGAGVVELNFEENTYYQIAITTEQ